uniref:UspA domain-containing protein n=1 Tax=Mycena chlorophos TaxID=658473 RepID=A0ABQ0L820_MYCCL|nr:predicted protein [Mycena chlorophos]
MAELHGPVHELTIPLRLRASIQMRRGPNEATRAIDAATGGTQEGAEGADVGSEVRSCVVVGVVSGNHLDFAISVWAAHRLEVTVFTLDPTFDVHPSGTCK